MLAMVRKHNPAAYFNGHDHQLVSAHDAENPTAYTTRYVTSGAGEQLRMASHCQKLAL